MIRRPLTVKGQAGTHKIIWDSKAPGDDARAIYLPSKDEIHIGIGLSKTDEAATLMHEILHVLIAEARDSGVKLMDRHEEAYADGLALRLCRLIADNPRLVSWIKERMK